jgi:hypothetical protein
MFRKVRRMSLLAMGIITCLWMDAENTFAQESFYKGKTIRLIVGLAPGGGFDTYSRVIARHMGKHIPGNPTTVVDNMPAPPAWLPPTLFIESPGRMASPSVILSAASICNSCSGFPELNLRGQSLNILASLPKTTL